MAGQNQDQRDGAEFRQDRQRVEQQHRAPEDAPPAGRRLAERHGLDQQRQQGEETAEQILASHDPAHGLDVDGQRGEKSGGDGGKRQPAGRVQQEQKEQHDVGGMQDHVAEMEAEGRRETEDARVDGPGDVADEQGLLAREVANEDLVKRLPQGVLVVEVRVLAQQGNVVVGHETESERGRVQREAPECQQQTKQGHQPRRGRASVRARPRLRRSHGRYYRSEGPRAATIALRTSTRITLPSTAATRSPKAMDAMAAAVYAQVPRSAPRSGTWPCRRRATLS